MKIIFIILLSTMSQLMCAQLINNTGGGTAIVSRLERHGRMQSHGTLNGGIKSRHSLAVPAVKEAHELMMNRIYDVHFFPIIRNESAQLLNNVTDSLETLSIGPYMVSTTP